MPAEGRLRATTASLLALMLALATTTPAWAGPPMTRIKLEAGPLSTSLREIARQTGVSLLFDPNRVAGLQARKIDARATPMALLQTALSGTNLDVRQLSSGALIIEAPAAPPMEQQDVAVSELLIVGRRTQNADIRREEDDIQRYRVITSDELLGAHVDTIGQFFDTRVSPNANVLPEGNSIGGSYSRIDLRGLGAEQTLVMVDGRRMPSFVATELRNAFGFQQPDISALPKHAIDRVETLTGTAGGIYGFGALGGAVNVVVRRDHPGVEAHLTTGLSSRGDAGRYGFEARAEFSPDHGATTIMLNGAFTRAQRLRVGQRDYTERDRRETLRSAPSEFLILTPAYGNSVAAYSAYEGNLILKSAYGGAALGSTYTYLPSGFEGSAQDLAAALTRHADQLDLGLSKQEAQSDLTFTPELGSLLVNVRRAFGAGVEGYFDGIMLWNRQRRVDGSATGGGYLPSDSPYNPFEQGLLVYYPVANDRQEIVARYDSSRFTVGLLAPMPLDWRSTTEFAWGEARFEQHMLGRSTNTFLVDANPFGSWRDLQRTLLEGQSPWTYDVDAKTLYREATLRLAGPLFETAPGRSTLTLLAGRRWEAVPAFSFVSEGPSDFFGSDLAPWSTTTSSFSAELRSTPFRDRPSRALGSLEVQLAVRHDRQSNAISSPPTDLAAPRIHVDFAGSAYTAGAKVSPFSWLMLRGSYATGRTPPPLPNLVSLRSYQYIDLDDPKRSGSEERTDFDQLYGGSPNLKSIRASTAAMGFVMTPLGPGGPRLSLDYSHIRRVGDVEYLSFFTVLEHEDDWPERVRREPLTDDDRERGYTGGKITAIDQTATNGGRLDVQTLQASFTWTFALPRGALRVYGDGAYNLENTRTSLFEAPVNINGYSDGPLAWRANGGVAWSSGSLTVGANLQAYAAYRINPSVLPGENIFTLLQGSDRVPRQTYLDLRLRKQFDAPLGQFRGMTLDLGVNNVLDAAPPRLIGFLSLGRYSPYGDPRRRRFELSLSAAF